MSSVGKIVCENVQDLLGIPNGKPKMLGEKSSNMDWKMEAKDR